MRFKFNKYTISIEKEVEQPIKSTVSEIDSILPIELIKNDNQEFLNALTVQSQQQAICDKLEFLKSRAH